MQDLAQRIEVGYIGLQSSQRFSGFAPVRRDLLSYPRLEKPGLHARAVERVDLHEPGQNIPLVERLDTTRESFIFAEALDQPPDDSIGDEGWQTVVKLRKLDSHVAVISRPGLVGALSGQRHLHLAAGELADEIKAAADSFPTGSSRSQR